MKTIKALSKRSMLIIMDGYAINPNKVKNAVEDAKTPFLRNLFASYPWTTIESSGLAVGLPEGVTGNSEVGHLNIGAGRRVKQDLVRINEAVEKHEFRSYELFNELISKAKKGTKRIHLHGLLSDGGVHSHIDHIKEIITELAKEKELKIFFHALMDGRDTARDVGHTYVDSLLKVKGFHFASMQGRSLGMDRDKRWEKIKTSYDMMIGNGATTTVSPIDYIKSEYQKGIYDEFVNPVLFNKEYAIQNGDVFFMVNYRPDRAIQISVAMNKNDFPHFERPVRPSYYLCMTPYCPDEVTLPILFDKENLTGGLSEILSTRGKKQFKIAETEKFAHVTYFFNGGRKEEFPGEERALIPSPKECKTYDEKPEMSAYIVTEELLKKLDDNSIDNFTVNFANCDMVGHTGNYEAAIKAVETVDACVEKVVKKCLEKEIGVIITADHGNADQMVYENNDPHTSHTSIPVPFLVVADSLKGSGLKANKGQFALKDIAPTLLYMMGEKIPEGFEGKPIFP